jgi:hypothetical protein
MQNDDISKFSQIVMASHDLPPWVRDAIQSVDGVEEHILDQSYLRFLEEQIDLAPRGPEWTNVLEKRREALSNYCGKPLLSGIISSAQKRCYIRTDPESKSVVYWDAYELESLDKSK